MASGRGLNEIVLAQLGALNFFVWAVADSMSSTQLRTYTGIEYILYMYNLGTAPNVQNWAGFAVCTPGLHAYGKHSDAGSECQVVGTRKRRLGKGVHTGVLC